LGAVLIGDIDMHQIAFMERNGDQAERRRQL
jgi:hypothetical protein